MYLCDFESFLISPGTKEENKIHGVRATSNGQKKDLEKYAIFELEGDITFFFSQKFLLFLVQIAPTMKN